MSNFGDSVDKMSIMEEKHKSVFELALAVARFKNARKSDENLRDEALTQLKDEIKNAFGAVCLLGIRGEEFFKCLHSCVYYYNTRVRKTEESYLALADFRTAEKHLDSRAHLNDAGKNVCAGCDGNGCKVEEFGDF